MALARLLVAVTDGFGVQRLIEGEDLDLTAPLLLFAGMIEGSLAEGRAAGASAESPSHEEQPLSLTSVE